MSQHDMIIANQGFPAFRADLNASLQALASTNSGSTAPNPPYANQLWYDTANNILKIRNEDNDAWISIFELNQTSDSVANAILATLKSIGTSLNVQDSSGNTLITFAQGNVTVAGTSSLSASVRLSEDTDNGTNYVELKAPATLSGNVTLTLPDNDGTPNQVLVTDGDGNLSWGTAGGGFSGANDRAASSSDIILTSTDAQTQIIRLTATGLSVTLPDATTLSTEGTPVFYFVNLGNAFTIKNASGSAIGFATGASCMTITLADNSSSAGKWQLSTNSVFKGLVATSTPTSVSYSSDIKAQGESSFGSAYSQPNKGRICVLSPTKMVVFYTYQFNQNSRGFRSIVFTIASNGITAGSTQDHVVDSTSGSNYYGSTYYGGQGDISLIRLTDTTFAFTFTGHFYFYVSPYSDTRKTYMRTYTGSISGSTVTLSSPSTFSNDGTTNSYSSTICSCRLSDTKYLIGFSTRTSTNPYTFYVCTDNGGSVSVGSGATLPGTTSGEYPTFAPSINSALALTDSLIVVSNYYYDYTANWVGTISGSTITFGSKQDASSLTGHKARISNTEFVSISSTQIRKHSISGTTISTIATSSLSSSISEFSETYGFYFAYDSQSDKIFVRSQFIDINTGLTGFVTNVSVLNASSGTLQVTAGGFLETGTASQLVSLAIAGTTLSSSPMFTVTIPSGF